MHCSLLWPVGGAQRTPVRQKMKTMSRSLQMLNVARLNVKEAQKSQAETEPQGTEGRGPEKLGKRRSGDKFKGGASTTLSKPCDKHSFCERPIFPTPY